MISLKSTLLLLLFFIIIFHCYYCFLRLDDELKKHVERTRRVNIGQEVLEAKMKVNYLYP